MPEVSGTLPDWAKTGNGYGNGYGNGFADGRGNGDGRGFGGAYGDAYGDAYGYGYGYAYGDGDGDGNGYGDDSGYGHGHGHGHGSANDVKPRRARGLDTLLVEVLPWDLVRVGCTTKSITEWRQSWERLALGNDIDLDEARAALEWADGSPDND